MGRDSPDGFLSPPSFSLGEIFSPEAGRAAKLDEISREGDSATVLNTLAP